MTKDSDLVRAMKIAVVHLKAHQQQRYAFNANLYKEYNVEGTKGDAETFDDIQFSIDELVKAISSGVVTQIRLIPKEEEAQ